MGKFATKITTEKSIISFDIDNQGSWITVMQMEKTYTEKHIVVWQTRSNREQSMLWVARPRTMIIIYKNM